MLCISNRNDHNIFCLGRGEREFNYQLKHISRPPRVQCILLPGDDLNPKFPVHSDDTTSSACKESSGTAWIGAASRGPCVKSTDHPCTLLNWMKDEISWEKRGVKFSLQSNLMSWNAKASRPFANPVRWHHQRKRKLWPSTQTDGSNRLSSLPSTLPIFGSPQLRWTRVWNICGWEMTSQSGKCQKQWFRLLWFDD
jgi:hypothetical protein